MHNPFLSAWLSAANAYWSAARGHAIAQSRRYTTSMAEEACRQTFQFWSSAMGLDSPRRRTKRRR
jgi:hypothetical protein